jgi:hypothetical protein
MRQASMRKKLLAGAFAAALPFVAFAGSSIVCWGVTCVVCSPECSDPFPAPKEICQASNVSCAD